MQQLAVEKDDSLRVELNLDLYFAHNRTDQEKALYYTKVAESIAVDKGLPYVLADAKHFKGAALQRMGDYDDARESYEEALVLFRKYDIRKGIMKSTTNMASLYYDQSRFEEAVELYIEALTITKELDHRNEEARILNYLGSLYKFLGQMDKSIESYEQALALVQELDFKVGISACLTNLGAAYMDVKQYEKARGYLGQALEIKHELGDKLGASRVLNNLGLTYIRTENYQLADDAFERSLALGKEVNNPKQINIVELSLAESLYKQNRYAESVEYLNNVIDRFDRLDDLEIGLKAYGRLADAQARLGDYEGAYESSAKYTKLNDSLVARKIEVATNEVEAKYQNEQKRKEMELLVAENNLKELELKRRVNERNVIVVLVIIALFIAGMFYNLYRVKQKTNKKLKELDSAKSNFFANISHEFRNPLTLIVGPISRLLASKSLTEDEKSNLTLVNRNADRLLKLVDQLLEMSRIEAGSRNLKVSKAPIFNFLSTFIESFTYAAGEKQIEFKVEIEPSQESVWFDKDAVEKITSNLLSNAIKYTPSNETIICRSFLKDDHWHFEVKNSGIVLPKQLLEKVFDRFYQLNENTSGVGLGLSLVKELVHLHKGSVKAESTSDGWTTFEVVLPVGEGVFSADEFSVEVSGEPEASHIISDPEIAVPEEEMVDDGKPIVLIVEDNSEVRNYVSNIFRPEYSILTAENGETGIEQARRHVPDIIISDVMMPVTDGITLSNTLKTDERTSHIPIVLLTAKAGAQNELEGLKMGIDDYITKPFKEEMLVLKVANLLQARDRLREKYSREIILKPQDIAVNSTDELFLKRLQKVLDEQLIDISFNSEAFGKAIGMSRMHLHRKLKALTGLTTSEFIRSQRLKLAAKMLTESDMNVSEIGYSVGFNNHAYFSKSFKDLYNCSPSEYAKRFSA